MKSHKGISAAKFREIAYKKKPEDSPGSCLNIEPLPK
jgi:hypothetical protein